MIETDIGSDGEDPGAGEFNSRKLVAVHPYAKEGFLDDLFRYGSGFHQAGNMQVKAGSIKMEKFCKGGLIAIGDPDQQFFLIM
jgi:hypothetical protein